MDLLVCQLGRVPYREALDLQHRLRDARHAGRIGDTLLLLEHDRVYTRGRRSDAEDVPAVGPAQSIEVVDVDRGGKVTYHGPGQLVGYPILAVDDVVGFVRQMERALIAALADEGLDARERSAEGRDYTGVWVEDRKIASIGIHVRHGITTHGFAVNVDVDLRPFEWIVPCGLPSVRMTSILEEAGRAQMACTRKDVAHRFAKELGRRQRLISRARLEASVDAPAHALG